MLLSSARVFYLLCTFLLLNAFFHRAKCDLDMRDLFSENDLEPEDGGENPAGGMSPGDASGLGVLGSMLGELTGGDMEGIGGDAESLGALGSLLGGNGGGPNGLADGGQLANRYKSVGQIVQTVKATSDAVRSKPSLANIFSGAVDDAEGWLSVISIVFAKHTLVMYDGDIPQNLEEIEAIRKTLSSIDASTTPENNNSQDVVFINVGAPEGYSKDDIRVTRAKGDLVAAIRKTLKDNRPFPMVIMKGICVAGSEKELSDAIKNAGIKVEKSKGKRVRKTVSLDGAIRSEAYDRLRDYLAGLGASEFFDGVMSENGRSKKVVLFGKHSLYSACRAKDLIEGLNVPNDEFVFIDVDEPAFYNDMLRNDTHIDVKKDKFSVELMKLTATTKLPYVFVDGKFLGDHHTVEKVIKDIRNATECHKKEFEQTVQFDITQLAKRKKNLEEILQQVEKEKAAVENTPRVKAARKKYMEAKKSGDAKLQEICRKRLASAIAQSTAANSRLSRLQKRVQNLTAKIKETEEGPVFDDYDKAGVQIYGVGLLQRTPNETFGPEEWKKHHEFYKFKALSRKRLQEKKAQAEALVKSLSLKYKPGNEDGSEDGLVDDMRRV